MNQAMPKTKRAGPTQIFSDLTKRSDETALRFVQDVRDLLKKHPFTYFTLVTMSVARREEYVLPENSRLREPLRKKLDEVVSTFYDFSAEGLSLAKQHSLKAVPGAFRRIFSGVNWGIVHPLQDMLGTKEEMRVGIWYNSAREPLDSILTRGNSR